MCREFLEYVNQRIYQRLTNQSSKKKNLQILLLQKQYRQSESFSKKQ